MIKFFLLPLVILELIFFYYFIMQFGFLYLIVEIILSGILGFVLLSRLNQNAQEGFNALRSGKIDANNLAKMQVSSLIGAILLIIPGLFTDCVGIIMQFKFISFFILKYKNKDNIDNFRYENNDNNSDIIDVEIIEYDEKK